MTRNASGTSTPGRSALTTLSAGNWPFLLTSSNSRCMNMHHRAFLGNVGSSAQRTCQKTRRLNAELAEHAENSLRFLLCGLGGLGGLKGFFLTILASSGPGAA